MPYIINESGLNYIREQVLEYSKVDADDPSAVERWVDAEAREAEDAAVDAGTSRDYKRQDFTQTVLVEIPPHETKDGVPHCITFDESHFDWVDYDD